MNCILQKYGVKNRNGIIYPKEVLYPQVLEYQKLVDSLSAVSEADHPDTSVISLQNISHLIKKMWWGSGDQEHILYGQLELIVTRGYIELGIASMVGDKILRYLESGIRLGISSRGIGSLKQIAGQNIVQNDFELVGFDLVATPSTFGAYLFPEKNEMQMSERIINNNNHNTLNESELNRLNAMNRFLL